jgi:hypothetical protein
MTKRKAKLVEMRAFVHSQIEKQLKGGFVDYQMCVVIEELYPFTWARYCEKYALNPELQKKFKQQIEDTSKEKSTSGGTKE